MFHEFKARILRRFRGGFIYFEKHFLYLYYFLNFLLSTMFGILGVRKENTICHSLALIDLTASLRGEAGKLINRTV